jgi:hypothetical protein
MNVRMAAGLSLGWSPQLHACCPLSPGRVHFQLLVPNSPFRARSCWFQIAKRMNSDSVSCNAAHSGDVAQLLVRFRKRSETVNGGWEGRQGVGGLEGWDLHRAQWCVSQMLLAPLVHRVGSCDAVPFASHSGTSAHQRLDPPQASIAPHASALTYCFNAAAHPPMACCPP